MSFTMAVATGADAADSLRTRLQPDRSSDDIGFAHHAGSAVAWSRSSPWLDVQDDGDTLVVLDGFLHSPGDRHRSARSVSERYRRHGVDVAKGLLGDFVLVVLDRRVGRLLVARDPLGVRPWYQTTVGERQAGASELPTLLGLPWVDSNVDEVRAVEYLGLLHSTSGGTLYSRIETLPPGSTWYRSDSATQTFPHHHWDLQPDLDISWDDAAERCRTILDEAVRCRLDPTGPATAELSGGLDSSIVLGTMHRSGASSLAAARLEFAHPGADERLFSDAVAEHWHVPLVSVPPWIPTLQEADELRRQLMRPLPEPNFLMFADLHRELNSQGRLHALTGLGGDDAFVASGNGSRVVSSFKLRQWSVLRRLARWSLENPRHVRRELLRPTIEHLAPLRGGRHPSWMSLQAIEGADLLRKLHRRSPVVTGVPAIDERIANITSGYDAAILEDRAIVTDLTGRRESHPFLDPRFIEATYGLDPWWPTRGEHTRALQVDAFRDRLPDLVAQRRWKAEFSDVFWPQVLHTDILEQVRSGPLAEAGWIDGTGFDELVRRAQERRAPVAIPLARCVNLDRWLRNR